MKRFLSLIIIIIVLASCNHSDDDIAITIPPISQLPPATQTGANTFGCLIDGVVFKPGIQNNSYNCFYQFVDGGFYFAVNASYQREGILKTIGVATQELSISQGQTLNLFEKESNNAYGIYYLANSNLGIDELYYTSTQNTGKLKITKLDFTNNIVSGTFSFDIQDDQNVIHQIREGRFDMQFTQ